MLKGIGTDLLEINRIEKVYKRFGNRFVIRILTKAELKECQNRKNVVNYLAKQFAAKEAVSKALGVGIGELSFQDMEILRNSDGKPIVRLSNEIKQKFSCSQIHMSLSDTKTQVLAFCIAEA